ncbi:DUF4157 domain-containing protein [Streptomyces sp. NPDC005529]|uniref:eCIS core domain-containing protein n=1 Tax=unclassified Streptomyces TaxID=2593676 RepID=UPI0033B525F8
MVRYQSAPSPSPPPPHAQIVLPPADPPGVERVPPAVAASFRATYSSDVSRVPVFRGSEAASEARSRNTRAFSRGGAVFLPEEEGPLNGPRALPLLGHELMHVVQQRSMGAALPHPHTPQGRALENQARAAETMLSGGAGASTGPAQLTHSPALDPSRYMVQLAGELLRQGLAHHDQAGNLVLGSGESLDSVDSSATITQHFGEEDLLKVKLQVLNELRGSQYTSLNNLLDDYAIDMHTQELRRWTEASRDELVSPVWLRNTRVDAMNAAGRRKTDGKLFTSDDLDAEALAEISREPLLFNQLEGEASGGFGSLPKIPNIVGLTWREADAMLRPVVKVVNSLTKRYRESSSEKDIVIAVSPEMERPYFAETDVVVVISSGRTRRGALSEAATSTLQTATALLGMDGKALLGENWKTRVGQQFGVTSDDETVDKPLAPLKSASTATAPKKATQPTTTPPGSPPATRPTSPAVIAPPTSPSVTPAAPPAAGATSGSQVSTTQAKDATPGTARTFTATPPGQSARSDLEERVVRMPAVLGMSLQEAEAALRQAHIGEYEVTYQRTTKAIPGLVFQATPGEKTFLGTQARQLEKPQVVLVVSAGHSYGALAAETGTELAGTLSALTGLKLSAERRTDIRKTFGVFQKQGKTVSAGPAEPEQSLDETLTPFAETEPPVPTTAIVTAPSSAPVTTTATTVPQPDAQQIATDSLDLDELADRLYSRLRSRLARELRNDRARAGMLSDYR